jgi:hypothetical protein
VWQGHTVLVDPQGEPIDRSLWDEIDFTGFLDHRCEGF